MSDPTSPATVPPPRSRLKRWAQNLALVAGTFLFCIVLLEVVLRVAGYGNLEIYQPDEKVYWRLKPNQDCFTKIDHKPVHINSLGTRGREFAAAKPPGTIRILSLGDSRTFGWGLTEAETYSARLEQALQQHVGTGRKVEVINAGVNAWSFAQMQVYYRDTAARYQPDVVILAEANLWTQFSEEADAAFVKKFLSRVRLKNILRRFAIYHFVVEVQLRDFYERNRTRFIPVDPTRDTLFKEQQQSDPGAAFRGAIEHLCEEVRAQGAKPLLLYLPMENELKAPEPFLTLKVKREVHDKLQVPLLDVSPEMIAEGNPLYLDADPVHLNARGNEIVARRLFEVVKDLLNP